MLNTDSIKYVGIPIIGNLYIYRYIGIPIYNYNI